MKRVWIEIKRARTLKINKEPGSVGSNEPTNKIKNKIKIFSSGKVINHCRTSEK